MPEFASHEPIKEVSGLSYHQGTMWNFHKNVGTTSTCVVTSCFLAAVKSLHYLNLFKTENRKMSARVWPQQFKSIPNSRSCEQALCLCPTDARLCDLNLFPDECSSFCEEKCLLTSWFSLHYGSFMWPFYTCVFSLQRTGATGNITELQGRRTNIILDSHFWAG